MAGGGFNPQVFRLLAGFNDNALPIMLKRRGLGQQVPGLTPGPPGRSDTVPAMLTPGEMVMNTGVTSQPDIAAQLAQLNMAGAQQMGPQPQGFEHGGTVQGGSYCPHCGMPHGQGAQGYAYGGFAGGFPGAPGRAAAPQMGGMSVGSPQPAAPQNPWALGNAGKWGNHPQGAPQQGAAGGPGGPWTGGYTYNPEGGVTNYNPNDPWGGLLGNRDPSATGQGMRTLGGYGGAGYFDPRGNQMLLNSMNEGAQGTADALVRRNMTAADLGGLDPAQRAVAKLQALRDTGRGVQDIMANTRAGVLGNANDFAQQLYLAQLQGSLGQIGQTNQTRLNEHEAGNAARLAHQNQWQNLAGGLLGSGLGGYFGGAQRQPGPAGGAVHGGNSPLQRPGYYPGMQP